MAEQEMEALFVSKKTPSAIEPVAMDEEMGESVGRLLKCLCSSLECRILGPALVREVVFRALCGQQGESLYALTQRSTHFARVNQALLKIRESYQERLSIQALARDSGLSVSAFHRAFKNITGVSPLQYLKEIRLNKAKSLILNQGMNIGEAATLVGYESQSQFSREFKRYFGSSPSESSKLAYQKLP